MTTKVHVGLEELHLPVKVTVEQKRHHSGQWEGVKEYTLSDKSQSVHEYVHSHQRILIEELSN